MEKILPYGHFDVNRLITSSAIERACLELPRMLYDLFSPKDMLGLMSSLRGVKFFPYQIICTTSLR